MAFLAFASAEDHDHGHAAAAEGYSHEHAHNRVCCRAMTASCLACVANTTPALFCAKKPHTPGCEAHAEDRAEEGGEGDAEEEGDAEDHEYELKPTSFQPKEGLTEEDVEKARRAVTLARELSALQEGS